jgi:anti-sigma regulatory factor (Ser/Thr protein kinase)
MIGAGGTRERNDEARHALLRYDSPESLSARAVPYVREGLARGEAVVVVVSGEVEQVLGSALGADAAGVGWQAGEVSYGRLGVMFEGFRRFLGEQRAAGVAMRLLAQNDTLGTEERMAAYLRFEAMANEVYRPYGYRWACLYDTREYSPQTLREVGQVHPRLLEPGGGEIPNGDYLEPSTYLARSGPPPQPPAAVQLDLPVTVPGQLVVVRRLLRRWADLHEMGEHADDVVSAVSEAVANGLQHGAPPVRVRAWTADRLARVQVHDRGLASIPVTAGYHRPPPELDRGLGLWVARQLADVVATHTDRGGTTVTLDFPLATRR